MARVKRGTTQRRRHNKILKAASGIVVHAARSIAKRRTPLAKAGPAYAHRKQKKRTSQLCSKALQWQGFRSTDSSYSRFGAKTYRFQTKFVLWTVSCLRKLLSKVLRLLKDCGFHA